MRLLVTLLTLVSERRCFAKLLSLLFYAQCSTITLLWRYYGYPRLMGALRRPVVSSRLGRGLKPLSVFAVMSIRWFSVCWCLRSQLTIWCGPCGLVMLLGLVSLGWVCVGPSGVFSIPSLCIPFRVCTLITGLRAG